MQQTNNDLALFNEIKSHPHKKSLRSIMKSNISQNRSSVRSSVRGSGQKQFIYIYVDDPKYQLGRGSFGQVYVCFYYADPPVKLALKIIKVPHKYQDIKTIQHIVSTSRQQILALIKLRENKNIIKIQDVIRDKQQIYMILQYCNDSDMVSFFGKLWKQNKITQQFQIRYYFHQILSAFRDLYKHNFIHRDIKPSNILVKNGVLKVADFGLARQIFQQRESIEEHVGTMITAAPQIVFREQYSNKCDIYSLGVIFYWMLYQKFPFNQKVPTIDDFKQNKLVFPTVNYIKVLKQTQQLVRQMLAYQQNQRISWKDLFDHPLFNGHNLEIFATIDQQIRAQYETLQIRQTYGRHYVRDLQDNDQLLDIQIPRSYYKFLQEIQGQDQYNKYLMEEKKNLEESPGIGAHIQIKNQYKNQNIKIKFFRMLLIQLQNFQIGQKSQNKGQMILIKDLIIHGIQKYLIYVLNRIRDQLVYISPIKIFKLQTLKEADKTVLHKNFVEQVNQKVRGSQFFTGTKFTEAEINKLKNKCDQYEINEQVSLFFCQLHSGLASQFLNQLNGCIIEMIYFLKPWIFKMTRKNLIQKDLGKFKTVLLLIHHLFMFSMLSQVFPEKYDPDFDYQNFIQNEQFKQEEKFNQMRNYLFQILSRFQ